MARIIDFEAHKLLQEQADELGLTYNQYRYLLDEKRVPIGVALENARRDISLDTYLNAPDLTELVAYQELELEKLSEIVDVQKKEISDLVKFRNTLFKRRFIFGFGSAIAASAVMLLYAMFNPGPTYKEIEAVKAEKEARDNLARLCRSPGCFSYALEEETLKNYFERFGFQ